MSKSAKEGFGVAGDDAAAYYDTAGTLGFPIEAVEAAAQRSPSDFKL